MILLGQSGTITIERDSNGVPQITAAELGDALHGLGFCHGRDRGLQMLLVRIAGRGRMSEFLQASDECLELDRLIRRLNFGNDLEVQAGALTPRAHALADEYCRGVNAWFSEHGIPWELRLGGYRIDTDPWRVEDILLTAKVIGYFNLAQSQAVMERFLVECVQAGIGGDKLEELFPGQLHGLDEELVRQVRLDERLVPGWTPWPSVLTTGMGSNNWVVSGTRTASGRPMLCNDPHLEVNRLPAVWYECVLRWGTKGSRRYALGATMPGVPGILAGRTPEVGWGATYAFGDCIDSWMEECREGEFRRANSWRPFSARLETIRRKKKAPIEICFHENDHGVLEGDPSAAGYYLASRWSCGEGTGAAALEGALGMLEVRSVEEGRLRVGRINNCTWNWVLADRDGNIAYQMSGQVPLRRAGISGLIPLRGTDPRNDWLGFVGLEDLPRALNPPEGLFLTANHDLNCFGRVHPINLAMGPHRAQRILALLNQRASLTVEDMKQVQLDLYSIQAERFVALLRPLLSGPAIASNESAQALLRWDLNYSTDSEGAFVFERFYRALIEEVFGSRESGGLGPQAVEHLLDRTGIFAAFYDTFDRVMLAGQSAWFGPRSRDEIYQKALDRALLARPERYGATRTFRMKHLLFGGRLPVALGFDRGPFELAGSRATVAQGQIFQSGSRETSFAASLRLITDMATDVAHTQLAGGPSDRRFSRWYANGIGDWRRGRFKLLRGLEASNP